MGSVAEAIAKAVRHADGTDGVVVDVWARPSARQDAVTGIDERGLHVSVSAPPEKGKANKAIVRLLTKLFGRQQVTVALLSGETSRRKRFLVSGVSVDEARSRILATLCDGGSSTTRRR